MAEILTLSATVLDTSPDGAKALVAYAYSDNTTFTTWIDVPPLPPKADLSAHLETAAQDAVAGPNNEQAKTAVTVDQAALQ